MPANWEIIAARKREARDAAILSHESEQPAVELNAPCIESADAKAAVELLAAGKKSAVALVRHSIVNAIEAQKKTNCLTEVLFEDAVRHAQALDQAVATGRQAGGPLHGIPMTLKDQFNVRGYDSTIGYVGRAFAPAEEDSVLVKMLRSLGAVILAKTNLPQSIMWCETENPLWGLTTNPIHKGYTPGGSTGGESALLAMGGSMVGWGTDIGGSIRIPSHMMGLCGLKPSSARLPYHGVPVSTEGQEHVPSSVGPMARHLSSIEHTMKSVIAARPWEYDARCAPLPWRQDMYDAHTCRPLTIGVLLDDGVVRPHPPITRVLQTVVEALGDAGHDVFAWDASLHAEGIAIMDAFYTVDGCHDIQADVGRGGEPLIPHVERLVRRGSAISVHEYWQLNRKKWALQQAYLEKWKTLRSPATGRPADVIIMPPMPHTSVPHGGCRWVGYTKIWNLLDYSALVIPAGKIAAMDRDAEWRYTARNETDEWNQGLWEKNKEEMVRMELPVGLQIVARRLEEEKVLAAGKVIEDVLRAISF